MHTNTTEFVIFDVETTGLSPADGDRIIEIAAVRIKEGHLVAEFHSLINPKRALSQEAMNINQITEEMIADAPLSVEVLPRMIEFIGGGCVAGHNVRFDLNFLGYELSLHGRKIKDETPVVDTLKMAKELLPYLSSYRLGYIARSLGVSVGETHRAMADVKLTAAVFLKLMDIAHDKNITHITKFLTQFGVEKPSFKLNQATAQASLF